MRLWCAHFPCDVTSAGKSDEVHSTTANIHCTGVRLPPEPHHPHCVLNLTCPSGMVSQYFAAPFAGKLVDYPGPWSCSLIASILSVPAFGLSAWIYASTPQDIDHPSSFSFKVLVVCFGLAGAAQACSWVHTFFPTPHLLIPLSASSHRCLLPRRISQTS